MGWLVHGPVFFANWNLARRLAKAPSDLIARTYMPGLYLVLAWYLLIAGVLAAGLRAADLSMWWAAGFLLLAPKLGDVAVAWRHRWRRRQFMVRARSWPAAERERLATAYNSLVAWWEESSPDSHPAPPADSIKLPRSYRSDHSNSSADSQQA